MRSCRNAGIHVLASRIGQYSSLPSSSLKTHTDQTHILKRSSYCVMLKIKYFKEGYLSPTTCPDKIPPVMKIEVPIPMAPRSEVGAISPRYCGWTQMATPVRRKHGWSHILGVWVKYKHVFYWNVFPNYSPAFIPVKRRPTMSNSNSPAG